MSATVIQSMGNTITNTFTSNIWGIVYTIITTISFFFLFEECGEEGWKRFIPIYGDYIAYKTFYKKSKFVLFVIAIIALIFSVLTMATIGAYTKEINNDVMTDSMAVVMLIALAVFFISLIIMIMVSIGFDIAISHKFGKKGLFTFGMIFLTPLFLFALAWENRKKLN